MDITSSSADDRAPKTERHGLGGHGFRFSSTKHETYGLSERLRWEAVKLFSRMLKTHVQYVGSLVTYYGDTTPDGKKMVKRAEYHNPGAGKPASWDAKSEAEWFPYADSHCDHRS